MKFLLLLFPIMLQAQVVWTAPVDPQPGVPGKLVITDATAGNPTVSCTITGNAVPATALTFACAVGSITQPTYTIQFSPGISYTLQFNFNINTVTGIFTCPPSGGIQAQASSHGAAPGVQGSF